jgi:hypothetical protein
LPHNNEQNSKSRSTQVVAGVTREAGWKMG